MVDSKTHLSTSLKIRSNKHRCFLFCHEHSSLTCVPGIGKKNKQLLNQSGVYDLTGLFQKYRELKNIQHFKDWLNNRIGFTKYQARMAACGISTKIGETKEIDTGLISLGSLNERSEENQSIDDIKKHRVKTRNTRCRSHRRFLKIVKDMKQIELQTKSLSTITDFPDRTPLKNTEVSEKFNPFQWIKQEDSSVLEEEKLFMKSIASMKNLEDNSPTSLTSVSEFDRGFYLMRNSIDELFCIELDSIDRLNIKTNDLTPEKKNEKRPESVDRSCFQAKSTDASKIMERNDDFLHSSCTNTSVISQNDGYGKKSIENESSTNGENQRLLETDTTYTDNDSNVTYSFGEPDLSQSMSERLQLNKNLDPIENMVNYVMQSAIFIIESLDLSATKLSSTETTSISHDGFTIKSSGNTNPSVPGLCRALWDQLSVKMKTPLQDENNFQ